MFSLAFFADPAPHPLTALRGSSPRIFVNGALRDEAESARELPHPSAGLLEPFNTETADARQGRKRPLDSLSPGSGQRYQLLPPNLAQVLLAAQESDAIAHAGRSREDGAGLEKRRLALRRRLRHHRVSTDVRLLGGRQETEVGCRVILFFRDVVFVILTAAPRIAVNGAQRDDYRGELNVFTQLIDLRGDICLSAPRAQERQQAASRGGEGGRE